MTLGPDRGVRLRRRRARGPRPRVWQSALRAGSAAPAVLRRGEPCGQLPASPQAPRPRRGRPGEGTALVPTAAQAGAHRRLLAVANFCLGARALRVRASPPGGLSVQSWAWRGCRAGRCASRARNSARGGHAPGPAQERGAGPARSGVCAWRSPRTQLGVGFVRACSHLRGPPEFWGGQTSAVAAPERTRGD